MPANDSYFVTIMLIIMGILLLAIILLANVVSGVAEVVYAKEKQDAGEKKETAPGKPAVTATIAVLLLMMPFALSAQGSNGINTSVSGSPINGLSPTAMYFIFGVLGVEVMVIFVLLLQLRTLLSTTRAAGKKTTAPTEVSTTLGWWGRINRFRPLEKESEIDLDHEYDGIRELDNRLPPWWLYGFYLTILFAGVYLWRYHVSNTAPLSAEEFRIAMQSAEEQKAQYLKRSKSNVDENTVVYLSSPAELESGRKVYEATCSPCHGKNGEGTVGPNLTDQYWMHGGSIGDIFRSIKYGWPEKGMKSWKDDLSPVQIAQLSSYIKSLAGREPGNGKEPQGDLYSDSAEVIPTNTKPELSVSNE